MKNDYKISNKKNCSKDAIRIVKSYATSSNEQNVRYHWFDQCVLGWHVNALIGMKVKIIQEDQHTYK